MYLSRTYQRRKLMLLTKLPVAVGLAGVALAANAVTYTPGTYTEKVNGHNAAFTVNGKSRPGWGITPQPQVTPVSARA